MSTWDFHLQNGSPCVDKGNVTGVPDKDIEGKARPGADGKVCMGAYESPDAYTPGAIMPPKRLYVSKSGNNTTGLSWETAFSSINNAINKMGDNPGDIWIAEGIYIEGKTINILKIVNLIGGFKGYENDISQRDISNNKTIIDGEDLYQCIKTSGFIDGLYITQGKSSDNGGGVYNYNGTVINCIIFSNSVFGNYASGGGIYNKEGYFTNCMVYSNSAPGVGGIDNSKYGTVTNCAVYSNSGHGIYNEGAIINCTVYSNSGVGIYNNGAVINCIVWANSHSDIFGLSNVTDSCFGESDGKNKNIRGNPLFVNTTGDMASWDFHLQNGSPCVDNATIVGAPVKDIEGNARPGLDGKVCMGAYESPDDYTPGAIMPPKRLYVSKSGNNTTGLSWQTAFSSIINAINEARDDIYEIWIVEGEYIEGETIKNPSRIYLKGGFKGFENDISQRDIINNKTIIDGEDSFHCIINYGDIDGLYITKGKSSGGGGVYNNGTVTNCAIYSNSANWGGGVYNDDWRSAVKNCTIYSNSAQYGSGVYNRRGIVANCTVYSNSALGSGGIYNWEGTVTDCIVWKNSVSDINGLSRVTYSCFSESDGINGNINQDPLFVKSSGDVATWDFHLQDESPCIDAGNPAEEFNDGCLPPGKKTVLNDMGAYGGPRNCGWSTPKPTPTPTPTPVVESDFYATPTLVFIKKEVRFFDQSIGEPDQWEWDFGDLHKSNEQNPIYAYDAPGIYTVSLAVSGPYGTDTETKKDYIVIKTLPTIKEFIDFLLGKTKYLDGDLNGDGKVDMADLVSLILIK